jgi:two-component system response regulator AtoC
MPENRTDTAAGTDGGRRLLVVDDEANMRHMLRQLLGSYGYDVDVAKNGEEALDRINDTPYDFILCDIKMPGMGGLAFLEAAGDKLGGATTIMMSAYGSVDTALSAMKKGAYDYISKPFNADEIRLVLKKAEERERLRKENIQLRRHLRAIGDKHAFGSMVGQSKGMQELFRLSEKVARYDTTVLITGESGTGKELVARGIHFAGQRVDRPWIPVNCGSIPENLIESELFGYRKGAFTGANKDRPGLFREADGGTIFLDEIGELPLAMQVKLLRVLQEGEVRPIGGESSFDVDVRVIAATARNLEDEVQNGRFREDLYYRLNVMQLELPPLRQRGEDIPLLVNLFLERFNKSLNTEIQGVSPQAMALLLAHTWPGNVRELENVIQRAVVLCDGDMLDVAALPEQMISGERRDTAIEHILQGESLKAARKALEKIMIRKALRKTDGNRTRAARMLEISHPSLLSKIKTYGIKD